MFCKAVDASSVPSYNMDKQCIRIILQHTEIAQGLTVDWWTPKTQAQSAALFHSARGHNIKTSHSYSTASRLKTKSHARPAV